MDKIKSIESKTKKEGCNVKLKSGSFITWTALCLSQADIPISLGQTYL